MAVKILKVSINRVNIRTINFTHRELLKNTNFLGDKKPTGPPVIEPKIKRVRRPKKTE